MVLSGALNQSVHGGEVEFTFLRLDQPPIGGSQNSVAVHGDNFWPHRLHVRQAGRGGIFQFSAAY